MRVTKKIFTRAPAKKFFINLIEFFKQRLHLKILLTALFLVEKNIFRREIKHKFVRINFCLFLWFFERKKKYFHTHSTQAGGQVIKKLSPRRFPGTRLFFLWPNANFSTFLQLNCFNFTLKQYQTPQSYQNCLRNSVAVKEKVGKTLKFSKYYENDCNLIYPSSLHQSLESLHQFITSYFSHCTPASFAKYLIRIQES